MWHEARKHEKKIKGMMVDYKRRAERRKDFYEKIRRDPAQFLQIHGRPLKIHIDASISQAAENSLMPWLGDSNNMIDRFDARAHLDSVPTSSSSTSVAKDKLTNKLDSDMNYERWRNLVQNEFLEVPEAKVLHQIYLEERFGGNQNQDSLSVAQQNAALKKKLAEQKAAIGFNYDEEDDSTVVSGRADGDNESNSSEDSESDGDLDTTIDLEKLTHEQGVVLNNLAQRFGIKGDDFIRHLEEDKAEAERIRLAKEVENEKSMFAGRKSRRERKALKERRMLILRASGPVEENRSTEKDVSDSSSSESDHIDIDDTKVEFITCFGESSEEEVKPEEKTKSTKKESALKSLKRKVQNEDDQIESDIVFGPSLPTPVEKPVRESPTRHQIPRSYRADNYRRSNASRRSRSSSRDSADRYGRTRKRSPFRDRDRRRRSRSRTRDRDRRPRSRSRDRNTRSRRSWSRDRVSRRRSRSKSKERRYSRDESPKRSDGKSKSKGSPEQRSRGTSNYSPKSSAKPASPPVKSYYRRDLLSDESDDSDNERRKTKKAKSSDLESGPSGSLHNTKATSSSSRMHERLMKKTRKQIEKHYKEDKKAEKSRIEGQEKSVGATAASDETTIHRVIEAGVQVAHVQVLPRLRETRK